MTPPVSFHCAAALDDSLCVVSIDGIEALSRPYRFVIDLVVSDPNLPLDELLGRAAVLWLGARRVHGMIAEVEQGDGPDGAYGCRVVLVPRLWSASLGSRSRVFQDLTVTEIASAVLGEVGVTPELRLTREMTPQRHVVQYRESGLDFVSRLLETEGVAYHFIQDEAAERLVFTDDNLGFRERVEAAFGDARAGAVRVSSLRGKRRMTARSVLLHDEEGGGQRFPIQAEATIDESGVGAHVEHGVPLGSPERAARLATQWAQARKAEGDCYAGRSGDPVSAGQVLDLSGHARRDFNTSYLVTSVHHRLEGGHYAADFEALASTSVYRPPCATPKPRIEGMMKARVETSEASAEGAGAPYRVRLPFDLGGSLEGQGSPPVPLLSPDAGMRFQVASGSTVMLGFVAGDPDRPVIAGAVPDGGSAHAPQPPKVIFETSASGGPSPAGRRSEMEGRLAEQRQLAKEAKEEKNDEWIRFAVPFGAKNDKWSYLRYGARTGSEISSGGQSFQEDKMDGEFTARYYTSRGESIDDDDTGHTFTLKDLAHAKSGAIGSPSTYRTAQDSPNAGPNKATFSHFQSDGVFDYTDGNRTVITQGDLQSVTAGHRTDVILGDYRVVIPARTAGIYDADDYFMRFSKREGSWRKTEVSHVKSDTWAHGDQESFYLGFDSAMKVGTSVEATFGLNLEMTTGFKGSIAAGFTASMELGPTITYSGAGNFAMATKHEFEADEHIIMRLPPKALVAGEVARRAVAASAIVVGGGALVTEAVLEFQGADTVGRSTALSVAAASFLAAMVASVLMKGRATTEAEPSIEIYPEYIKLSIGTSSITLDPLRIVLETGNEESSLTLTGGVSAMLACQNETIVLSPTKGIALESGGVGVTIDPAAVINGPLMVDGNVLVTGLLETE